MINAELTSAIYKAIDEWDIENRASGDGSLVQYTLTHPEKPMELCLKFYYINKLLQGNNIQSGTVSGSVEGIEWSTDLMPFEAQDLIEKIRREVASRSQTEKQKQRLDNERAMAQFAAALMA